MNLDGSDRLGTLEHRVPAGPCRCHGSAVGLAVSLAVATRGCALRDPAAHGTAQAAFSLYEPAASALHRYAGDKHGFPQHLGYLVPEYLRAEELALIAGPAAMPALSYERGDADFMLGFSFDDDGSHLSCARTAFTAWRCSAYE